jgi:phage gp36-like protein
MTYASQQDLEHALGSQVVKTIFDDDMDGVIDAGAMTSCLAYGDAEVDSFLSGQYEYTAPMSPVPAAVKYAAVDFCCAYAARRRPDLVRAMGEEPWTEFRKAALEKMTRFAKAQQRLPATAGVPANVTTTVKVSGVVEPDELPDRVFDDMGSF